MESMPLAAIGGAEPQGPVLRSPQGVAGWVGAGRACRSEHVARLCVLGLRIIMRRSGAFHLRPKAVRGFGCRAARERRAVNKFREHCELQLSTGCERLLVRVS
jgi:hypothetical protein